VTLHRGLWPRWHFGIGLRVRVDSSRFTAHISARNCRVQGFRMSANPHDAPRESLLACMSNSCSRHRKAFIVLHVPERDALHPSAFCLDENDGSALRDGFHERDGRCRPSTLWSREW
jgi:hypothetical protein